MFAAGVASERPDERKQRAHACKHDDSIKAIARRSEFALELGDQPGFIEIGKDRRAAQCGIADERNQQCEPQRDEYAGEPAAG